VLRRRLVHGSAFGPVYAENTSNVCGAYDTVATATSTEMLREFNSSVTETQSHTHFALVPRRQSQTEYSITHVFAIPFRYRRTSTLFYFRRFQPRFKPCRTRCGHQPAVAQLKEEMESGLTSQDKAESKSTVSEKTSLTVDSADTSWSSTDIVTSLSALIINSDSDFATTRLVATLSCNQSVEWTLTDSTRSTRPPRSRHRGKRGGTKRRDRKARVKLKYKSFVTTFTYDTTMTLIALTTYSRNP